MDRLPTVVLVVALSVALVGPVAPAGEQVPEGLGEVDGISHDTPLSVTGDDPTEDELTTLVTRAMARIEVVRGLAFEESVDVEVITREEYRAEYGERTIDNSTRDWENVRWEALFVVGSDRDARAVIDETLDDGVQGFYDAAEERIVLVSDDGQTVDKETLIHELVHALQHQQFGLDHETPTTDAERAYTSLLEGEAELVPTLYLDRCGVVWSCVTTRDDTTGAAMELGVQLHLLKPYVQGQAFVGAIRDRGGWDAVDDLHENPPVSSTQVIHPERYPDHAPVTVTVADRSTDSWERLDRGVETLGEASIYAMLVHSGAVTVEDSLAYEHPFSEGWAGDTFVAYERNGTLGYVWETVWETETDADQFAFAYRELLDTHGGVDHGDRVDIPDGPFAGAYELTREGTTVRIVNAPSESDLDEIH